jgi:hypothetical protein
MQTGSLTLDALCHSPLLLTAGMLRRYYLFPFAFLSIRRAVAFFAFAFFDWSALTFFEALPS